MSIERVRLTGMSGLTYDNIALRNVSNGTGVENKVLDQVAVMSAALQRAEQAGVDGRG
jgi:hypothetical protein